MWHASVKAATWALMQTMAERALKGVGSPTLGQWTERGRGVFHLRRRLSKEEAEQVNEVRDIRGTAEQRERLDALLSDAPHLRPALERARLL